MFLPGGEVIELFLDVLRVSPGGFGGGFLQLGVLADDVVEVFLKLFLFGEEGGIVGVLGELLGEFFLLGGDIAQARARGWSLALLSICRASWSSWLRASAMFCEAASNFLSRRSG